MAEGGRIRGCCILLRNLVLAALLYTCIYGFVELVRNPSARVKGKLGIPAFLDKSGPADIIETTKSGVKVKFAGTTKTVTINPHANVFNRPVSAVVPKDDYLGPRPHVDTEADLQLLVEECRGTYDGIERMRNVFNCLHHISEAELPSKTSIGTCPGPIIPYHVYWTGPATWRVEVFIKSYLYTQNLACSRLWIWLDSDRNPKAVDDMLHRDPLFARFLPLVDRGDIVLKAWEFPSRIPLPKHEDNTDGLGYYKTPGKPNAKGEVAIADGIVEDETGQQYLALTPKQITFLPVAVSNAMRFVVLHLHGGAYFNMDVLMLRDMRPLLLPPRNHSFAERWTAHPHPGDYNTAVMSLSANSSLSSYLLRGGMRMGVNFHSRVIGRMAWKDGRDREFFMLETAAFDPVWPEFNWDREGRCTVPCLRDYGAAFKGKASALRDEWESYDGPQLERIDLGHPHSQAYQAVLRDVAAEAEEIVAVRHSSPDAGQNQHPTPSSSTAEKTASEPPSDSFRATSAEEDELRTVGIVAEYVLEEDKFPPNNRTPENFFRGAWTYHVHKQWLKHLQPSSWISVLEHAHDGFFTGERTNPYGEKWTGPPLMSYNYWPEFA